MHEKHSAASSPLEWSASSSTMPGEEECGDLYLVRQTSEQALVAVFDGLGHGREAAVAAKSALDCIENYPGPFKLESIVNYCHSRLLRTRGVVVSMAFFDFNALAMTWLGVGNVEGTFFSRNDDSSLRREVLLLKGGVLGYKLPSLQSHTISIKAGDLVIFNTDGIKSDYSRELDLNYDVEKIAGFILEQYKKATDDALVLVIRYKGKKQ